MKINKNADLSATPTIPEKVYEKLPPFLKEMTEKFDDPREKDVVLTSCLTMLGGCFSGVKGQYGSDWTGPSLFSFIVAPPANRKGSMKYAQKLGAIMQERLEKANAIARDQYESDYRDWKRASKSHPNEAGDQPKKPKCRVLFIPGNSSAAAMYWLLSESDGKGIICETEADSLAGAIKQDWGNFSHLLRCAFHSEPITLARKGEREYLRIEHPQLSVLLSGTPDQVPRLIGSTEDGLYSRFLFYCYNQGLNWIDQTPCKECIDYSAFFSKQGLEVHRIGKQLETKDYTFSLTDGQFKQLNLHFAKKLTTLSMFEGDGAGASVIRLGLIAFRIAMILSVIRRKDELKTCFHIECSDEDFEAVMGLVDVYFEHTMVMYALLPRQVKPELSPKVRELYTSLPMGENLQRKMINEIGKSISISEKSAGNYLKKLVELDYISNPEYGIYFRPLEE